MSNDPRANRHYESIELATLKEGSQKPPRQDTLFMLYGELCTSWRMLTDVRFKLLGLIPIVSGVILFNLLSNKPDSLSPIGRTTIVAFGLLITIGLYIYDTRNSELYNDLISRGRKIEEELGIDTGQFRGRPKPTRKLIRHGSATGLIYGTAMLGWLFTFLAIWLGW